MDLIEEQYFEKPDMSALVTEAIKAMVKQLDPHSKYLTPDQFKKNNENLHGNFGGVGIQYQILHDTLLVLYTTSNGPAETAGIQAGDKLIRINDTLTVGENISNTFFSKQLRGKKGTKVNLTVKRRGQKELLTFEVERGPIPIETVNAAYMLDKDIGYIKITGFSFSTNKEFIMSSLGLQMQGMKHLILDLRGNPGGLMIASIRLAGHFLKADELIVYTQGEHYPRENYNNPSDGNYTQGRLIVLVDELSASASEILAGAMQDLDRGLIVGRRSYGKGLVGRNFTLPDESALRLTTGQYYTPSGRCIQKPFLEDHKAYKKELEMRDKHGEFLHPDSIKFPDSLKYTTSNGRTIYAGGGIMPDIFIPKDTLTHPLLYDKLQAKGIISLYAIDYFDQNLSYLNKEYKTVEAFKTSFDVNEEIFKNLLVFAKEEFDFDVVEEIPDEEKQFVMDQFKWYLGRYLFKESAYYQLSWERDEMIPQCLQIIKRKKEFSKRKLRY